MLEDVPVFDIRPWRGDQVPGFGPSKNSEDRRHEVLGLGWFGEESIRAEIQGQLLVSRIGVGGRVEDKGNTAQAIVRLPVAAKREAVHDRHEDVGDDQVGWILTGLRQCLGPIVRQLYPEAPALQKNLQEVEVFVVVVHDQHTFHRDSSMACGCR